MSYSLYLWHWPILALGRYTLVRDETLLESAGLLSLIVAASYLSWSFVEKPFRRASMSTVRLVVLTGSAAALLIGTAAAILTTRGLPSRLDAGAARINAAVGTNYRCPIGDYLAFGASRGCILALPSRNPADADVVLLGNSHAQMYAPLIAAILHDHGLHGLLVPANGCLPWRATNIDVTCASIAATNLGAVAGLHRARVVIIGFSWRELRGALVDAAGQGIMAPSIVDRIRPLDDTIATLRAAGKRVVVIGPIAEPGWDVASELSRRLAFGRPLDRPLSISKEVLAARYGAALASLAGRRDITLIRPDLVQCRLRCDYLIDGNSLFADDNHLAVAALPRFRSVFEPAVVAAAGTGP